MIWWGKFAAIKNIWKVMFLRGLAWDFEGVQMMYAWGEEKL